MMKKPRGRGDLVLHKVAGWVGVDVKCAPGEVTEETRMAASMSVLQSKKSESSLQGTEEKKKMWIQTGFFWRIRKDITDHMKRSGGDILGKKRQVDLRREILTGGKYADAHIEHRESQVDSEMWIIEHRRTHNQPAILSAVSHPVKHYPISLKIEVFPRPMFWYSNALPCAGCLY